MWKLVALGLVFVSSTAIAIAATPARALITRVIDETALVTLAGNTRPEANTASDRGRVEDTMPLDHMTLQLQRAPEQEEAVDRLIAELHDPASPRYHQWLEPAEIGARFGLAATDLATVTGWLETHGFRVNFVHANGLSIDFSGTAGQLRNAFHTEMHRIEANGEPHLANFTDPKLPAALAPVVAGIVTLNDFAPRPQFGFSCNSQLTGAAGTCESIVPADLATIYDFNLAFNAGITGKGQRIALIEHSDPDNLADWTTFRTKYGLSGYTSGTIGLENPQPGGGLTNCTDPGINGAEDEAILDAEWASAAAPNAAIMLEACKLNATQDGVLTAIVNVTERPASTRPQIIGTSTGECEANMGATHNAAYATAFQTAVMEGISIYVAAGDMLSADCDSDTSGVAASYGVAVNGHASTPYAVAVGGTDFADTLEGEASAYWTSTNSAVFGSAKSYIPEIPWNESCAEKLIATYLDIASTYGANGLCNNPAYTNPANNNNLAIVEGGGGGASACATGAPASSGVIGSTCAGYAEPSWQKGMPGMAMNGVRNLPDVSIFAGGSVWRHSYVICATDQGGCVHGWHGTSFGAPIMAGVQALVDQYLAVSVGNPNTVYYRLAAAEYATGTQLAACNSTGSAGVSSSCVFHDVTVGSIDAPCIAGTPNCYAPSGAIGVLTSVVPLTPPLSQTTTYQATSGWDFATGLGSVDVYNLLVQWKALNSNLGSAVPVH
jgi:subtilase family serine protease